MAIDATRGLPSFSEMYTAFKNRGGLAEAITGGLGAYYEGKAAKGKAEESAAEIELKRAQAKKALAEANKDPYADYQDISTLAPVLSKEQFDVLKLSATPVGGKLMVPKSQIQTLTPLVREQGAERRAELAREAEAKRLEDMLAEQARRQRESERASDERQAEAQRMQALTQVAGEKIPVKPVEKMIVSPIKEFITGAPTDTVAKLREQEAAKVALKTKAGLNRPNPVDEATGINVFDSQIPTINTQEEYDKLPKGTKYRDSYGNLAVK